MSRPLDFIVIADHAEYMGVVQGVSLANEDLTATEDGARWSKMASEGGILEVFGEMVNDGATGSRRDISKEFERSVWQGVGNIADKHNDPGTFTAFVGYEYSSLPEGDNLHRIVIFADSADKTNQVLPLPCSTAKIPSTSGHTCKTMKIKLADAFWRSRTTETYRLDRCLRWMISTVIR